MKQILFFILFSGIFFSNANTAKAQSLREPATVSQKADDGLLVAYPNPVRDILIVRAKDPAIKIKSLTFYSILGVQVQDISVNMNSGEVNLERLRPGKYLMRYVLNNNTQKVIQILKQ